MDLLDQSEVDALLNAVTTSPTGEAEAPAAATVVFSRNKRDSENYEIRDYDFKRPERVSKDQMRALETLHEAFARNFGAQLSGFLRTIVEVKVANIEQLTFAEFIHGLPNPTSFNLISCSPLEGQVCLEISPLIIYPIIDRLLGGSNADLFIPQRPLTQIEQRLVSKITDRGMLALAEAWANILKLQFKLTETESNPQLVQIVPPNEVVVVVGFEIKMSGRAGTMSLCIPFNVIEPVMNKLISQNWQAYKRNNQNDDLRIHIRDKLERASLAASVELARTTITVRDLMGLAAGDLIMTEKPASSPVLVCIEGKPKFMGSLGQFRGKRAVQVVRGVSSQDRF